ncbi:MAG: ROK family protein [Candidatus Omnitrophica bacterium]|nr:ROK family protein [Candidatus Omnitrophota bacterium]
MAGKEFYIGVDIGGTKIAAALVDAAGKIHARDKIPSGGKSGRQIVQEVSLLIKTLFRPQKLEGTRPVGVGIAVPGLVDTKSQRIVVTPNMDLSGTDLAGAVSRRMRCPVKTGNDVNLGVLGEQWRGAARRFRNVVGLFPGTGLGGGVIIQGELLTGSHGAAAELGHMIVDPAGHRCTCGNKGCLEAYVGRWAIQRDIRKAVRKGKKTIISKLTGGDLTVIKSKVLAKALGKKDKVAVSVMRKASRMLGVGCLNVRHIFDPEIIILGGGLMEACGDFILPIVRKAVRNDPFFAHLKPCAVEPAALQDDAVILGAVRLCMQP